MIIPAFITVALATLSDPTSTGPHAVAADPRVIIVDYDENAIIRLDGCFGYQTMIEFDPADPIENVGLGEASEWLVTPNRSANLLFVKPAYRSTRSNMTVATARRRYGFDLRAAATPACARGDVVYRLRFRYAADDVAAEGAGPAAGPPAAVEPVGITAPQPRNSAYTFSGASSTIPQRVFDDGERTFFLWQTGEATPAVYVRSLDGAETVTNFTAEGDYLVVDQTAPAFVLRRGDAAAVLFNDAYPSGGLDAASPQPRAASSRTWPFGRRRAP